MHSSRISQFVTWIFFFSICLGLGLWKNPEDNKKYLKEIRSDKAGYYIYLPATFIYGFDESGKTDEIDPSSFAKSIEYKEGKLYTKYSCGVAWMQMPFFLGTHSYNIVFDNAKDGFNRSYESSIIVSAAFYASIGLLLFWTLLKTRIRNFRTRILVIAAMFFGTNLYYYVAHEPGMSHAYSFFLFAALTFLYLKGPRMSAWKIALIPFLVGMIVLTRPVNILIIPLLAIFNIENFKTWLSYFIRRPYWILLGLIPWIPQFIYWYYLSGNWIYYSYENEGFNWLKPEMALYFFSTAAGVFPHTPLYLLAPILFIGFRKRALAYLIVLVIIAYIFSSWHSWSYGCSFGSRPLVEYTFLWIFVFYTKKEELKFNLIPLARQIPIFILIAYTFHLSNKWGICWYYDLYDYTALYRMIIGTLNP